jgi:predicted Ser/Thr protein kinase
MAQVCTQCGAENDDDGTTCFTCGHSIQAAVRQGELVAARYEIRDRLGRGGMGAVYRAHDRVLDEDVALKVLREDAIDKHEATRRFRTEIKLARRVIHRNVCRIFEYGEDQGRRFISMELIEGTDLKRVISAGSLPTDQAFSIAIQIAEGLDAIHGVGVLHRDLKTSNIMLDASGTVRLMDFGIAKHVDESATGATASGTIMGTPAYMSPEQARGEKLDFRSDIYSLGVVIYELFTGRVPFDGDTPVAVILKHIHDPPPLDGSRAEGLPTGLIAILSRALAKSRDDRHQSAAQLAKDLIAIAGSGAVATLAARVATQPWQSRSAGRTPTTVPGATHIAVATQVENPGVQETIADTRVAARPQVALRDEARKPARATAAWAIALALLAAAIAGVALLQPARDRPSALVSSPGAPPLVAPSRRLVSLNALPWARVRIVPAGEAAAAIETGPLITPCVVDLLPGSYTIELENGGLTPPSKRSIQVGDGPTNAFVFTMPSFDPGRAASLALEQP